MELTRPAAITIGNAEVQVVGELGPHPVVPDEFIEGATPEVIARHRSWLAPHFVDDEGCLISSVHSYVVRTESTTMVVDTCFGNDKQRPWFPPADRLDTPYLDRLLDVGVAPEDVDVVVCTHLHIDHVGWNTRLVDGRWVPTFPRARYVVAAREWEHWRAGAGAGSESNRAILADSVQPVVDAGQAVFVDTDHAIDPEIHLEPLPGHTPGHVGVRLASGSARAVFTGDLFHSALQVAEPQLALRTQLGPEWDRELGIETRRSFLEDHADRGIVMLAAHFPSPWGFEIVRHGASWRPRPS